MPDIQPDYKGKGANIAPDGCLHKRIERVGVTQLDFRNTTTAYSQEGGSSTVGKK
jgi:hypothetical protein